MNIEYRPVPGYCPKPATKVLLAFCASASQRPTPTPGESGHKPQSKSQNKAEITDPRQGTPESASAAGAQPITVHCDFQTGNGSKDQQSKAAADWGTGWTAIFTGVLALVAALQWSAIRRQGEYMRAGLKETQIAAEAAKSSAETSEKALRLAHRAVVGFSECIIWVSGEIVMDLKNEGPTSARNVKIFSHIASADGTNCMPSNADPIRADTMVIPPGATPRVTLGKVPTIQDQSGQVFAICDVLCSVTISYEDIFGDRHKRAYVLFFDRCTRQAKVEQETG